MSDPRFKVVVGELNRERVDAVVNPLGPPGEGGHPGLATGAAWITRDEGAPARYVIHVHGPAWAGGRGGEDDLLATCYLSVFALLEEYGLKSVALPALGGGRHGYPPERAARIAVNEILYLLERGGGVEQVVVVCATGEDHFAYREAMQELAAD